MKILVTTKLSDKKLNDKLNPIVKSANVKSIDVIRYKIGNEIPKVTYFTLPKLLSVNLIIQVFSLFLLLPLRIIANRPDIIIGIYYIPYGFFAQFYGKIFRIPSVCNLIGSDINQYPKKPRLWKFIKRFMKRSYLLTTTGTYTKQFLISEGFNEKKIEILPNPINPTKFYPLNINKEFDIITISNLIKRKRVDQILLSLVEIKEEFPNIKLAIVGDGEEKDNLQEIAMKLNLSRNVEFLGYRSDINELLNKSKIFVLFSEAEGLPVAMMEAMAAGIPVITTDVGDTKDVISNEINGIILSNSNPKLLSGELIKLLSDESKLDILGTNALSISKTNSPEFVTAKWNEIFTKIKNR